MRASQGWNIVRFLKKKLTFKLKINYNYFKNMLLIVIFILIIYYQFKNNLKELEHSDRGNKSKKSIFKPQFKKYQSN